MPPPLRPAPAIAATLVVAAAATVAAALLAAPRTAEACSAGCSGPAHFVPGDGATVPVNLPAIYWRPRPDDPSPAASQVTLTTAADPATPLAFTATMVPERRSFLLVPDAPLVVGTQYVLTDATTCPNTTTAPPVRASFTVGPAAPLPTTLGVLAVSDLPPRTTSIATHGGGCSTGATVISAAVTVDFATAPEATPWRDVLHYQTYVDGAVWQPTASILSSPPPGASWEGRGFDRVFSVCRLEGAFPQQPSYDLPQGEHQVQLRASLPGAEVAIQTSTRAVTLMCPPVLPPDGDAGLEEVGEPGGGCCSSSTGSGGAASAGLALLVALALVLPARSRC